MTSGASGEIRIQLAAFPQIISLQCLAIQKINRQSRRVGRIEYRGLGNSSEPSLHEESCPKSKIEKRNGERVGYRSRIGYNCGDGDGRTDEAQLFGGGICFPRPAGEEQSIVNDENR